MAPEKRVWRFGVPGYLSHPDHFSESSVDSKKSDENSPPPQKKQPDSIAAARLVRCAFNEAALGNEGKARGLWASAIKKGYEPKPKNVKGFEFAISKGLRETRR